MDPVLCFQHVSFSYDRTPVLNNVSFDIAAGEPVVLVGPNGSGKTTLIRLALGSLKPQGGTVRVLGADPALMRSNIAYIPQMAYFDPSFPITVREVVSMGCRGNAFGKLSTEEQESVLHAMEKMNIIEHARRPFGDLSGGLRQRTLIARALTHPWRLFILDEPYSNVDEKTMTVISELVMHIAANQALILITHDTDTLATHFSRVLCLNNSIVEHNTSAPGGKRRIIHD